MKRRVLWVVNGEESGAMGFRARGLSSALGSEFENRFLYRPGGSKLKAARTLLSAIENTPADVLYVLDMAISGVTAALLAKLKSRLRRRLPVVIDTGDAITALAQSANLRGPAGIFATWLLEQSGLRWADCIVVRGSFHRDLLAQKGISATWIPDGFESDLFSPPPSGWLPPQPTLGLLGSIVWNGSIEATYGWELIEALARPELSTWRGLIVGAGSGWDRLRDFARQRNVADRIEFPGRVAYGELRPWLHRMTVCLSTQTNDLPGQVRTTGKLPLYLACGRFILASRVGEASRVLPESMLIDYEGSRDLAYPAKLAQRLSQLAATATDWEAEGKLLAQRVAPRFAYPELGGRLGELLRSL